MDEDRTVNCEFGCIFKLPKSGQELPLLAIIEASSSFHTKATIQFTILTCIELF